MDMKNKNLPEISQELLKELFDYSPKTGLFTRIKRTSPSVKIGDIAGTKHKKGYIEIRVGKKYKAHRLVWLYTYGYLPKQIDHINGVKDDNRLENLREVDNQENQRNTSINSNNKSGATGVYFYSNRWRATIGVDGKHIYLGDYVKYSDAVNSRKNAEVLYGFHKNHGRTK